MTTTAPPNTQKPDELKLQGNAHYKKKEFSEAIECYEKAWEMSEKNDVVYLINKAGMHIFRFEQTDNRD